MVPYILPHMHATPRGSGAGPLWLLLWGKIMWRAHMPKLNGHEQALEEAARVKVPMAKVVGAGARFL